MSTYICIPKDVLALGLTAHDGAFFGMLCLETDPSTLFFIVNPCLVVFLADILLSHFLINLFKPEEAMCNTSLIMT